MKNLYLIFITLSFILLGCLNYEQEVNFNTDGSGEMKIHYWMKSPESTHINIIEQIGIFNEDSIKNEFSSTHSIVNSVSVQRDTTDSTIHAFIELSFTNIDSLNETKPFSEANFSLKDGAAGQKIFSQFITPIATGFGFDGSSFNLTYTYIFPGEIITHNATKVSDKKLIWKYSLSEIGKGKTISVTYRPFKLKETPYWIYMLSGAVLLIVLIFLFRKRKN